MSLKNLFAKKPTQPADSKYPKWDQVSKDLSFLPKRMLGELQKAMLFIVNEDGNERAAVIIRADNSEFNKPITSSTPVRLHIGFYAGRTGDVFSVYPLVLDNPNEPFFKETWINPYDDAPGIETTDPLSMESRKKLQLLFNQPYIWMLFVDNRDQVNFIRKVNFTPQQVKSFKQYNKKLAGYQGKQLAKPQYFALLQEYMNSVPMQKLHNEFMALFRS